MLFRFLCSDRFGTDQLDSKLNAFLSISEKSESQKSRTKSQISLKNSIKNTFVFYALMISELPCVINNYTFFKLIGKGGFSSVYLVRSLTNNYLFCAKVTQMPTTESTDEEWKTVDNEIQALTLLNHPHIIRLYDHFHDNSLFYMILEYCSGGNLQNEIPNNKGLSITRFKTVAGQIISALVACHRNNIAHHDLKLGNILLDEYKRVKLADFGISVKMNYATELSDSYAGSIQYESPEIVSKIPHDPFKADIWALGVLFAHLISGQSPWRADNIGKLKRCIASANYTLSPTAPPELVEIIKKMIVLDPSKRLTMNELARNPFFNLEPKPTGILRVPYIKDCMCPVGRKAAVRSQNEAATLICEEEDSKELTIEELTHMEEQSVTYKNCHTLSIFEKNQKRSIGHLPLLRNRYHAYLKTIPTFADNVSFQ